MVSVFAISRIVLRHQLCRKKILGNVVHNEAAKATFETLNSRMNFAPVLLIHNARHNTNFVVATDARK